MVEGSHAYAFALEDGDDYPEMIMIGIMTMDTTSRCFLTTMSSNAVNAGRIYFPTKAVSGLMKSILLDLVPR